MNGACASLRQPARDFGLAHAGGTDHEDVLGRDLVAQVGRDVLPAPAVAQRDRDRALGFMLADDIAVELGDDLARGHYVWNFHLSGARARARGAAPAQDQD